MWAKGLRRDEADGQNAQEYVKTIHHEIEKQ